MYTGDPRWEVCATGQDFNPGSGGPSSLQIDNAIVACNTGGMDPAATSGGWVNETGTALGKLAIGEDNTTPRTIPVAGNEFPIVCDTVMDGAAKWMWFNWDPANINWPTTTPFLWPSGTSTNVDHQFLIFRLESDFVPLPQ